MELFLLLLVFVVAVIAFVRADSAHGSLMETNTRLRDLGQRQDQRIAALEARLAGSPAVEPPVVAVSSPATVVAPTPVDLPVVDHAMANVDASPAAAPTPLLADVPVSTSAGNLPHIPASIPAPAPRPHTGPPPLPSASGTSRSPAFAAVPESPAASAASPPPMAAPPPLPKAKPAISLEMFLGARLFAWLGGLAMFLGVIYGIRYAFEHNWISPAVRVGAGFATGLAFMITGLKLHGRERYKVLAQAFAATGVLVLYGVTFASHAVYHFAWFTEGSTFAIMSLITAIAFLMAVRMDAQVVAVLGMVGGFITPPLCSTGADNPLGLFSYIALLDIGLICVAWSKRWFYLVPLGTVGTIIMQFGWLGQFFNREHYEVGGKTWIVVAVFCGFTWLMTVATRVCGLRNPKDLMTGGSALAMAFTAMVTALIMLNFETVATRPVLLYGWVMLVNAAVLYLAWMDRRFGWATGVLAGLTFLHLGLWTVVHVTNESLNSALVIYFLFGVVHTAFSLLFVRRHGSGASVSWMPVITLVLIMVPLVKLPTTAFALWPAMLISNLLVIGIAFYSRRLLPILAALLLTLASVCIFLHKLPVAVVSLWPFLGVLGLFAVLFVAAGLTMAGRVGERDPLARWMPALSAVLPFALLVIATVRLPISDPSAIFGFAVALAVFLLLLAWRYTQPTLVLASVLCLLAVQYVWGGLHFHPTQLPRALAWFLGVGALYVAYPLLTNARWKAHTLPWISSAIAMIGSFGLVYSAVRRTHPDFDMGLLPLGFAIVAMALLFWVLKNHDAANPARQSQLAWLGGTALFFITLIFPLQFHRQWLTIGWALEGAALCWLYLRVPHPGLRYVATGLLTAAFIRLAFNVEVLHYHVRTGVPVWNWFLYSYGLVAAAQLAAAKFLAPPHDRLGGFNLQGLFKCFGGVLLFLLMNIEITDAFTPRSETYISFQFRGDLNLAREMTYTISWGLFALVLLMLGFHSRSKATRYTGMALLGITLFKLFFHDLAGIDGIYRVGALMVVAVIAFMASWLYQRFAETDEKQGS